MHSPSYSSNLESRSWSALSAIFMGMTTPRTGQRSREVIQKLVKNNALTPYPFHLSIQCRDPCISWEESLAIDNDYKFVTPRYYWSRSVAEHPYRPSTPSKPLCVLHTWCLVVSAFLSGILLARHADFIIAEYLERYESKYNHTPWHWSLVPFGNLDCLRMMLSESIIDDALKPQ